jgi:hypothetical protein
LGERLLCKQEVDGSIPFTSTTAQRASSRAAAAVAEQPRERRGAERGSGTRRARLSRLQEQALRLFDTNDAMRHSVGDRVKQ